MPHDSVEKELGVVYNIRPYSEKKRFNYDGCGCGEITETKEGCKIFIKGGCRSKERKPCTVDGNFGVRQLKYCCSG